LRALPASVDSEYYVLAHIINHGKIDSNLESDCFFVNLNQQLFKELKKHNNIQKIVEENPFLEEAIRNALRQNVSIAKAEHHIERLLELKKLRNLIDIANYISETAYNKGDIDLNEIVKQISKLQIINGKEARNLIDCVDEYFENYDKKIEFIQTHFKTLDKMLKLEKSDLVIIAARPSMGKTAFQLQLALNMALSGRKVHAFSLEMKSSQLIQRILANIAGIALDNIREKNMNEEQKEKLIKIVDDKIRKVQFKVSDDVFSFEAIKKLIRKEKAENGLDVVFIDFLGLINNSVSKSKSRNELLGEITRTLKQLAKEEDVLIILLSQLSRGVDSRTDRRPILSDLRDSGEIEQDADSVIMLYRDEYYNETTESKNIIEIIIRKQRQGQIGTVPLYFQQETQKIRDLKYET
jgi:replicative DNA helicase